MIYDLDIAKKIAESLLQINAIILQPHKPFKWAHKNYITSTGGSLKWN